MQILPFGKTSCHDVRNCNKSDLAALYFLLKSNLDVMQVSYVDKTIPITATRVQLCYIIKVGCMEAEEYLQNHGVTHIYQVIGVTMSNTSQA